MVTYYLNNTTVLKRGNGLNGIAWMIVFCEIAFWVVIVLGLAVRYVFKRHTLGLLFLALTPVIDLILLAATGGPLPRSLSDRSPWDCSCLHRYIDRLWETNDSMGR